MEINPKTIKEIEKKLWQLVLLAIVIILFLTLGLLGFQIINYVQDPETYLTFGRGHFYAISLSLFILMFCGYLIVHQRRLLNLSKDLYQEKSATDQLNQNLKTLRSLLQVTTTLNAQHRLGDLLNTIVQEMVSIFNAHQSSIMLVDAKNRTVKTKASYGQDAHLTRDALVPLGKSIAGWVVQNGKPLLINGQVDPIDYPGMEKKERFISSAMCVPLCINSQCIGVLNVNLAETNIEFSEADLQVITIFANSAAVAIQNRRLSHEKLQRTRFQALLEQMHSPQVVQELVQKIGKMNPPNKIREIRHVTVLFADIRGFSNIINRVKPEIMMDFLDEFYRTMTQAVFAFQGSIDKFIGDEVMAYFGAPLALPNACQNGFDAACRMLLDFKPIVEKFIDHSSHFNKLGLGIGINAGEAYVGNVGSCERYDFTVIGQAVNLARRLCSQAAVNQIVASETLYMNVQPVGSVDFEKAVSFKGFSQSVDIYKINLYSDPVKPLNVP